MTPRIGSTVVVGAGTMGAQIAALLAGAGVRVRLFDVTADVALGGLDRVAKLKPAPFYTPAHLSRIRVGGLDQDGALESAVADAEWVLEAIVEQLEPKRALFATSRPTPAGCPSAHLPTGAPLPSDDGSSGPTSSTRRATRACWSSSRWPTPIRRRSRHFRT